MTLVPRRVVARFLLASPRSFFARRETRLDLYGDVQKQFRQFQSGVFALTSVATLLPDEKTKDQALNLIDDLPALLDATIGLPHEAILDDEAQTKLLAVKRGLGDLEVLLVDGIQTLPPKVQYTRSSLVKAKVKSAYGALDSIGKFLVKYVQEAKELARKTQKKDETARQKAEKDNAWCQKNCEPCKDDHQDRGDGPSDVPF